MIEWLTQITIIGLCAGGENTHLVSSSESGIGQLAVGEGVVAKVEPDSPQTTVAAVLFTHLCPGNTSWWGNLFARAVCATIALL